MRTIPIVYQSRLYSTIFRPDSMKGSSKSGSGRILKILIRYTLTNACCCTKLNLFYSKMTYPIVSKPILKINPFCTLLNQSMLHHNVSYYIVLYCTNIATQLTASISSVSLVYQNTVHLIVSYNIKLYQYYIIANCINPYVPCCIKACYVLCPGSPTVLEPIKMKAFCVLLSEIFYLEIYRGLYCFV